MDGRRRAALAAAARRGDLGMTQEQLAGQSGVSVKTIGNLESRGRWPVAVTRARLEKALGWPPGELDRLRAAADGEPGLPALVAENAGVPGVMEIWALDKLPEATRLGLITCLLRLEGGGSLPPP